MDNLERKINDLETEIDNRKQSFDQYTTIEDRKKEYKRIKALEADLEELKKKKEKDLYYKNRTKSIEGFIGKNLMGLFASVLIIIGIIIFAISVGPYMNDATKEVLIIVSSLTLLLLGYILYLKQKNPFYLTIQGIGIAGFYISIFMGGLSYHLIDSKTMMMCICLWCIVTCFLSFLISDVFKIIGYIGFVISIIYLTQLDMSSIYIGIIFYIVSLVFMFIKSNKYNEQIKNIMIIINMVLLASITSSFRIIYINIPLLILLNSVYVLILFVFINKNNNVLTNINTISNFLIISLTLYMQQTYAGFTKSFKDDFISTFITKSLMESWNFYDKMFSIITLITIVFFYYIISKNYSDTKTNENKILILCLLPILFNYNFFTKYIIISILFFVMYIKQKSNIYQIISYSILSIYVVFNCDSIYKLSLVFMIALIYLIIINILTIKNNICNFLYIIQLFIVYISSITINDYLRNVLLINKPFENVLNLLLFIIGLCIITLYEKTKYGIRKEETKDNKLLYICVKISYIIAVFDFINSAPLLYAIIVFLLGFIVINYELISLNFKKQNEILIFCIINTIYLYKGSELITSYNIIITIFLIIISFASILYGFIKNNNTFRLYGLSLTIICIVKLIFFDISLDNTMLKAAVFIIAGLLCLVVNYIYTLHKKNQK